MARFATAAVLTTKELIRFVGAQLLLTVSAAQPVLQAGSHLLPAFPLLAQVVSFALFLGD